MQIPWNLIKYIFETWLFNHFLLKNKASVQDLIHWWALFPWLTCFLLKQKVKLDTLKSLYFVSQNSKSCKLAVNQSTLSLMLCILNSEKAKPDEGSLPSVFPSALCLLSELHFTQNSSAIVALPGVHQTGLLKLGSSSAHR